MISSRCVQENFMVYQTEQNRWYAVVNGYKTEEFESEDLALLAGLCSKYDKESFKYAAKMIGVIS